MLEIFKYYVFLEINEETGDSLNQNQILLVHYENINKMQAIAYEQFPDKLSRVSLKNVSLIDNRENIKEMLDELSSEEAYLFAKKLDILRYSKTFYNKALMYEIFIQQYIRKESILEKINNLSLYPTEKLIWDNDLIPTEFSTGDKVLAIPKLNLQFLTHYDYLMKNFNLFRLESTFEIKYELEDVIERVHPLFDKKGNFDKFEGWARMAVPIRMFKILSIKQAEIGKMHPSEIIAEIEISLNGVQQQIKNEWDKLKKYDVLFLVLFENKSNKGEVMEYSELVKHVRGSEIISLFDEENNEFSEYELSNKKKPSGNKRRIQVYLDPIQYKTDVENKDFNIEKVYSGFQLLVRRKQKENNFKAILDTIRDLMNINIKLPSWFENVFLGYGDSKGCSNQNNVDFSKLDLKDTFVDLEHFEKTVKMNKNLDEKLKKVNCPRYLTNPEEQLFSFNLADIKLLKDKNPDFLKKNNIRFTENQVKSILSGINNGLTMIVGPPGTGKTDVAVQIINLINHNFPNQRTLIITRSNAALNDLFTKIAKLDINERYLLRLGYGEKDLEVTEDYSKNGRVNFMLARRMVLLDQVNKLAKSIEIFSHEEYTCESSLNFYEIHVKTRFNEFEKKYENSKKMSGIILDIEPIFPFVKFFNTHHFSDQVLFEKIKIEDDYKRSKLLMKYIENIFFELRDCYAFELLRNSQERGNYLMTKQAKVIAMTSTHAALKRRDFLNLGLEYDNVLIEESAQLLEIETFIPLLLQNTYQDQSRLKRLILIGRLILI